MELTGEKIVNNLKWVINGEFILLATKAIAI
jgi:hypothetical protein